MGSKDLLSWGLFRQKLDSDSEEIPEAGWTRVVLPQRSKYSGIHLFWWDRNPSLININSHSEKVILFNSLSVLVLQKRQVLLWY